MDQTDALLAAAAIYSLETSNATLAALRLDSEIATLAPMMLLTTQSAQPAEALLIMMEAQAALTALPIAPLARDLDPALHAMPTTSSPEITALPVETPPSSPHALPLLDSSGMPQSEALDLLKLALFQTA